MAGAAAPTAARAAAYVQEHVQEAHPLLPWIAVAADGGSPPDLQGSFGDAVIKPLETLVKRAYNRMWVSAEQAPAAQLAVRLAVGGLAAGLPPADAADAGMQASMLSLCYMLRNKERWDLLDPLAAGPCAPLFTSETGLADLLELATDKQGRLRLKDAAFPAVAKHCAAQGRVEGAAALLAFADEGGCANAAELAEIVCTALASAVGAAFLSGLAEARQARLCAAICKHGGGEHAARLLVALHGLPECQPRARRAVALALVKRAGPQCADLLARVPGLHATLAATVEALQERLQYGPPSAPNTSGWALPAAIVQCFQCDRSAPGQHCSLCQPVLAFMAGLHLETQPILRFEEGDLQDNINHLKSALEACQQRCTLTKFMQHRVFPADSKAEEGKGKKKRGPKRQVAAARLWKVDAWYHDEVAAYRSLRQAADELQAVLALVPAHPAPAAPAAEPAEPAAEATVAAAAAPAEVAAAAAAAAAAAVEPSLEQHVAELPEAAAEAAAVAQDQSAAKASPAQQAKQAGSIAAVEAAAEQPAPTVEVAAATEQPALAAEVAAEAEAAAEAEPVAAMADAVKATAAADKPATSAKAAIPAPIAEAMEVEEEAEEAAPSAAAPTPAAPAAAAQLLAAEETNALADTAASQRTPTSRGPPSRPLLQCTLLSNGGLSRVPPPEQEASQSQLANRRLSLGSFSTAMTAASGGSTARKRPAAGSTAKKGGGPGSVTRARLARDAQRLRLPTLYLWFKPEHQHLSEAECASLAESGLAPRRLHWEDGQEVDSGAVQAAAAAAAAGSGKRSRKA